VGYEEPIVLIDMSAVDIDGSQASATVEHVARRKTAKDAMGNTSTVSKFKLGWLKLLSLSVPTP